MKKPLIGILIVLTLTGLLLPPAPADDHTAAASEPFEQGVVLLSQGNYAAAAEKFTEALKLNPDLPRPTSTGHRPPEAG